MAPKRSSPLLKLGSRGKLVKTLQEFLQIKPDGIFGEKTKIAVSVYQSLNGLVPDGIVGPLTWEKMGLATMASTDLTETISQTKNGLLINEYFLPEGEYKKGPTQKEYLFLHHIAGGNNPYRVIASWGRDDRGTIGTEFVIGGQSVKGNDTKYDGEILQAIPQGGYAWHLGKNGSPYMHSHSVGIETCNFGYIENGMTYTKTRAVPEQIVTLKEPFRGHLTWHRYSDVQLNSLRELIIHIADRDSIDAKAGLIEAIKVKGALAFEFNQKAYNGEIKGMWTHTNTRKDKSDMFPQQELIDMLLSI